MLLALSKAEFQLISDALSHTEDGVALRAALVERAALGEETVKVLTGATHALRSYEFHNSSTELAAGVANTCDALMERIAEIEA